MSITSSNNYFEDFEVGQQIKHARGSTIDEVENQLLTKLVLNSAQGHWNHDMMEKTPFKQRLVFGFVTASVVIGLATQDTGENMIKELGLDKIKFRNPVFHGDTVYAYSEVLSTEAQQNAGKITFKHWGLNQRKTVVFEGERSVLLKRRPA